MGVFNLSDDEQALDRLTMLVQQLQTADAYTLTRDPLADFFDVGGNRLTGIADAEDPNDATSLQQVTQAIAAAQISPETPAADIALLSNLASTAAGKGAALIGYGTGTAKDQLDTVVPLAGGTELVCSGSSTEVVIKDNRAARANISGNSKIYYVHNIIGSTQTLGTMTSSITTPNLVNGASV